MSFLTGHGTVLAPGGHACYPGTPPPRTAGARRAGGAGRRGRGCPTRHHLARGAEQSVGCRRSRRGSPSPAPRPHTATCWQVPPLPEGPRRAAGPCAGACPAQARTGPLPAAPRPGLAPQGPPVQLSGAVAKLQCLWRARKTSAFPTNQMVTSAGHLSCHLQFAEQKTQKLAPCFGSDAQRSTARAESPGLGRGAP